ncbi:outer membrane beta-barrel protein [Odoribacter sp. OttesenSCG-928-L07]|nr:outer membrane beta-barrel protein [Odoribacter sp. OttesenSCG-928-L07]MDL2239481.1 outer membrane beta-barrel protein [Bacteroidales bacterium OttesenSCG-928-L14]MDL2240700.1 outer membrane beta-barrel protein [Bacteroidales bacterium OttesenSCG-928-K22]
MLKQKNLKLITLLLLFPTLLFSQEFSRDKQFIKNKFNVKLDYKLTNIDLDKYFHCHGAGLEFNYGFTKWLDAGVFCDFSLIKSYFPREPDSIVEVVNEFGETIEVIYGGGYTRFYYRNLNYGFSANVHILPLILKNPNFSLVDVYINGKIGMRTVYSKEIDFVDNKFYYSIGAGVGFNFNRKFGLFCEYNYTKPFQHYFGDITDGSSWGVIYHSGHNMRFGINIRF